jgi:amidase
MASINPPALFDVLKTTADDLRGLLDDGSISSVQIVESYLSQIDAHNTKGAKCRAVISLPPRFQFISRAMALDKERQEGKLRRPMHGIPILVKVITYRAWPLEENVSC